MSQALILSNLLLWTLTVVLAMAVLLLARQLALLYRRLPAVGALMIDRGPGIGTQAPYFAVATHGGGSATIGGESADGRSTLLLFVGPTCPVCRKLMPLIPSLARAEGAWLKMIVVSDGPSTAHAAHAAALVERGVGYVLSETVGRAYSIGRLPYAVLIDEAGRVRAKGLVNSREHLESLFEAKERGVGSLQEFMRNSDRPIQSEEAA
jgi:methylamine dehydrogenase accessory protein MauD